MIYIRPEGHTIRNGLNFYPWSDKRSFGFILRLGEWGYRVRFSTYLGRWLVGRIGRKQSERLCSGDQRTAYEEDEEFRKQHEIVIKKYSHSRND